MSERARPTTFDGAPSPHKNNEVRAAILAFLAEQYEPSTTREVAEAVGVSCPSATQYLKKMVLTGQVAKVGRAAKGKRGASVNLWV